MLDSGDHPKDTNNLMHSTNSSTREELTPTQRTTVHGNA